MRLPAAAALISFVAFAEGDQASKAFEARVEEYAKIRKAATAKVPPLPKAATPEQIVAHENALVEAIRAVRPNARPGDVFTPEVRPLFAAIIKDNLSGSTNQPSRAIARQGNPKHDAGVGEAQPVIEVNAVYPKSAPVSTMPPLLLMQLPPLPKDIEYRFVGGTLVLYDSLSNLIIDYIPKAAPGL